MAVWQWFKKNFIYVIVALTVIGGLLVPVFSHPGTVIIEGNVRYLNLEGGFWGIAGIDGNNYLPVNLDKEYKTDGIYVRIRAQVLRDQANAQLWGTPIKIVSIKVIVGAGG
jgi:hypothetical protein